MWRSHSFVVLKCRFVLAEWEVLSCCLAAQLSPPHPWIPQQGCLVDRPEDFGRVSAESIYLLWYWACANMPQQASILNWEPCLPSQPQSMLTSRFIMRKGCKVQYVKKWNKKGSVCEKAEWSTTCARSRPRWDPNRCRKQVWSFSCKNSYKTWSIPRSRKVCNRRSPKCDLHALFQYRLAFVSARLASSCYVLQPSQCG